MLPGQDLVDLVHFVDLLEAKVTTYNRHEMYAVELDCKPTHFMNALTCDSFMTVHSRADTEQVWQEEACIEYLKQATLQIS